MRDLKAKLAEIEENQAKKSKAALQALEAKNQALEEQVRLAEEEKTNLTRTNRRLERKAKELAVSVEEERQKVFPTVLKFHLIRTNASIERNLP